MPLPVAHSFVGAGIIAAIRPHDVEEMRWRELLLGAAFAVCPDLDFFFVWVLDWRGHWHRGFTHSILFAGAAGALVFALGGRSRLRYAVAYGLATLSHPILDILTTQKIWGVELLWPFSERRFKLGLFAIADFSLDHGSAWGLLADLFHASVIEFAVLALVFLIVLLLERRGRRGRQTPPHSTGRDT